MCYFICVTVNYNIFALSSSIVNYGRCRQSSSIIIKRRQRASNVVNGRLCAFNCNCGIINNSYCNMKSRTRKPEAAAGAPWRGVRTQKTICTKTFYIFVQKVKLKKITKKILAFQDRRLYNR